jgi:hypothetical protein
VHCASGPNKIIIYLPSDCGSDVRDSDLWPPSGNVERKFLSRGYAHECWPRHLGEVVRRLIPFLVVCYLWSYIDHFATIPLGLFGDPAYAQEVPSCRNAWNDLVAREALSHARTLIETDCPLMYREGWLINPSKFQSAVIPSCVVAWNALASKGALPSTRFLVMHNCPVIEREGWR